MKINFKVKNIIETEIAKKHRLSDINKNIINVKWTPNKAALKDIKKEHLDPK